MFSEKLRSLRERYDISQTRFAKEIGFSQAAISAWENNTREPGILALVKIAQYFNTSVDHLVGNSSKPYSSPQLSMTNSDLELEEILTIFVSLSPMHRAQVLEYARYFSEREGNVKNQKS